MTTSDTTRKGDWIQTRTGRQFWPLDPYPEDFDIEDIASSLSKLCRYNGHCSQFYSVAEHSVLVSWILPPEFALCGLLHDGTEAYCADVPRPLKPFLTGYAEIEDRIWRALAMRFGLPEKMPKEVIEADTAVLLAEKLPLMGPKYRWRIPGTPAQVLIRGLGPDEARHAFLQRFYELSPYRA